MNDKRFQIRIDPWWQPLLLAGGATRDSAFVQLENGVIQVQFGWLFRHTLRRSEIAEAVLREWPLWMGVGWRSNLIDQVALIGSYRGVVELRLHAPMRVWRVLRCRRLAISLEEPGRFLEALAATA